MQNKQILICEFTNLGISIWNLSSAEKDDSSWDKCPQVLCGYESRYLTRFSCSEYHDHHDVGTVQPLFRASFTSASPHSRCLVSRAAGLPQGVSCQLRPLTRAPRPLGHWPSAQEPCHKDLFLQQVKCPKWQGHPGILGLALLCPVLLYCVEGTADMGISGILLSARHFIVGVSSL